MGVISVAKIPKIEGRIIGWELDEIITKFYEDPENKAAFERWKAERDAANGKAAGMEPAAALIAKG